ncbi:hypothetical protein [Halopseudomonas pertucinogena]|uniref:Excisionase n=1 Tax=Halopseudomonas pertucinogena TaxID=86175 RepID=A0ABQ2CRS5_9GAMM|nr:hypothetical protein [Halopseudomonas pertucinogena]GGJ06417.1 hypothetical protein GCM10009083_24250 [Halopseudomonas pertucinogena]
MSAGSAELARWIAAGPNTWRIGKWTVYRSLLPQPVFWVSSGSGRPKRVETREQVLEMINENRD